MAKDDDIFVVGVKLTRDQLALMLDEVSGKLDFEVKIKMAKKQLGNVLAAMPPRVNPQIDRLVERDMGPRRPLRSGNYQPAPGTAPYDIMEVMQHGPVSLASVVRQLARLPRASVSSSFYALRDKGWIKRLPDGRYDLGPNAPQPAKPKPKPAAKKKKPKPSKPKVTAANKMATNGTGAEA